MTYTNITKSSYEELVRCYADTILFETTVDVIKKTIKEADRHMDESHWKNAALYSEFWRRNKQDYYFQAHELAYKQLGREVGKTIFQGNR